MRDSLGIEISGGDVRYVLISGGRVTRADVLRDLPLDEALNNIRDETGWEKAWVTLALPEFHVRRLSHTPAHEAVRLYMQFQGEDSYQWQVRDDYLAFAPKHAINSSYNLLLQSGIHPLAVEISGISIVRAFLENYSELADDNVVLVYFTSVANFLTFLKGGDLVLGISRPPSERMELLINSITSLTDLAFNSSDFTVFAGGELEMAQQLIHKLESFPRNAHTDLFNPFRRVKSINLPTETASNLIGALGTALRKR